MRILHLTLKKKWFDMIKSGEKKEEYREIKPYWEKRLSNEYDIVRFRNGYSKTSPVMDVEFKGVDIWTGNEEHGAEPGHLYYCIKLGKIIS